MAQTSSVVQRFFVKGLNAAQDRLNELPGIVKRISNLLFRQRGALTTCDGSLIISAFEGDVQDDGGPWTEIFLFQPTGIDRYYIGIQKDPNTQLAAPAGLALVDGGAGGTLAAATYYYAVTTLDGAGGETDLSGEQSLAVAVNHKIDLSWTAVTNANGYNIYRGTATGTLSFLTTVTTNSYTDTGAITPTGNPPTTNTTHQCVFYKIPSDYDSGDVLHTFPADPLRAFDGTDGGYGGGFSDADPPIAPPGGSGGSGSPVGGVAGIISPIPQIVQFTDKAVLALGNGYPPYLFTDPSTVAVISNTFQATYPEWQAQTVFTAGNIIIPTVANDHIYRCIQGGTSGTSEPTFPTTTDRTVADGSVIWQEAGDDDIGAAPPGAAHAIVHAGALWVFNTSPTNTADRLDGPSALRMSDVNNPTSWNPVNVAFIGKDDGSQGMGLASFSIAESGIAPTSVLIAFKEFSTYIINGVFGSANFAIQQAQTDLGCIAPRSIQYVPGFGIIRLTHLGVAVFDGVRDRLISEEIRPYLFEDSRDDIDGMDWNYAYFSKGAQVANPPMYVLAVPVKQPVFTGVELDTSSFGGLIPRNSRAYVTVVGLNADNAQVMAFEQEFLAFPKVGGPYKLTIDIPEPPIEGVETWRIFYGTTSEVNTYVDVAAVQNGTTSTSLTNLAVAQVGTPRNGTLRRLFCYDLVLKAWSIIDLPFDTSEMVQVRATGTIPITLVGGYTDRTMRRIQATDTTWDDEDIEWSFQTAEVFGAAPSNRTYFRSLVVRGRIPDDEVAEISCVVNVDGTDLPSVSGNPYQLGDGMFEWVVPINRVGLNAHATISGTGVCSIESVDWAVQPRPTAVPVRLK